MVGGAGYRGIRGLEIDTWTGNIDTWAGAIYLDWEYTLGLGNGYLGWGYILGLGLYTWTEIRYLGWGNILGLGPNTWAGVKPIYLVSEQTLGLGLYTLARNG